MANDGGRVLAPWHMWGSTVEKDILTTGPTGIVVTSQQIARIDYGRPETWAFLLAAQVNAYSLASLFSVLFNFKLVVGIGRSTYQINVPQVEIINVGAGNGWFCTSFVAPKRLQSAPELTDTYVDKFPAQSIQCSCTLQLNAVNASTAQVSVTGQFAPINHMRPEWFLNKFPGNEQQGS